LLHEIGFHTFRTFDISVQMPYYLKSLLTFPRPFVQLWKLKIHSVIILPLNFKYSINKDENVENYKIMRHCHINCEGIQMNVVEA
jgi:hypothetical protein